VIDRWEFVVEEAFTITGRGTGVLGTLRGAIEQSGEPAELEAHGQVRRVDKVTVEFARTKVGERLTLLLHGVDGDEVPAGTVVRGPIR
jgi:translation elongation factor EF-Tu-like GTPase